MATGWRCGAALFGYDLVDGGVRVELIWVAVSRLPGTASNVYQVPAFGSPRGAREGSQFASDDVTYGFSR